MSILAREYAFYQVLIKRLISAMPRLGASPETSRGCPVMTLHKQALKLYAVAMNYYAIQVRTRWEDRYIKRFKALHPEVTIPIYFPQRRLDIRREGRILKTDAPVFPGYIFIEIGDEDSIINYHWDFRRTEGFFRFLRSNQDIRPLAGKDLDVVLHFIKRIGPIAGKSQVYFDQNSRIVVVNGPLMGLEGYIIKVDKRKGRAKIKLDLYEDSFAIDLAFEMIQNSSI